MSSLLKRTVSGIVYATLLVSCILWCKYSFLALMLFFVGVMIFEFLRLTMGTMYRGCQLLTVFTALIFFTLLWAVRSFDQVTPEFVFLALIPLFALMVNSLYVKDKGEFGKFANVYTSLLYIVLPMSITNFLVMDRHGVYNGTLLICFFAIICLSDIGAYVFGMSFGQKFGRKLFPSISPKKSWIGFWGGLFVAAAASVCMHFFGIWGLAGISGFTWYHAIFLSILMNVSGVYGDLFESQWKRHYDVKDSGNIIPGHGGILDRLDSAIFAIPVGVMYLSVFKFITTL